MTRNTDLDWKEIAESEPFYGVLTHPRFLRENLTPEILREFWQSGEHDIGFIFDRLTRHFGPFRPDTALDFGCGVGRLTNAMSGHAAHVLGVDISSAMLTEARLHARPSVNFSDSFNGRTFSWVNSMIVLQHIHPRNGFPLIEQLLNAVEPEGAITLQITLYKDADALPVATSSLVLASWDGETLRNVTEPQAPIGTMMMYDYDLTRVVALFNGAGFKDLFVSHTNHGGNHGAQIYARRSSN